MATRVAINVIPTLNAVGAVDGRAGWPEATMVTSPFLYGQFAVWKRDFG
jgi:hypothetical protein